MNKPTLKPYIPKAFGTKSLEKANRTSQNLSISMSLPTLKNMLTKLKEIVEMKKAHQVTMYISHWASVS